MTAADRVVVVAQSTDFANALVTTEVQAGSTTTLIVPMQQLDPFSTVDTALGGTASNGTAGVVIPPNGLVPESGGASAATVKVYLTPINPSNDPARMPAGLNAASAGATLNRSAGTISLANVRLDASAKNNAGGQAIFLNGVITGRP